MQQCLVAIIIGVAAVVLAGCGLPLDAKTVTNSNGIYSPVSFWHDDARAVGCWIYKFGSAGSISCLPDSQYKGD